MTKKYITTLIFTFLCLCCVMLLADDKTTNVKYSVDSNYSWEIHTTIDFGEDAGVNTTVDRTATLSDSMVAGVRVNSNVIPPDTRLNISLASSNDFKIANGSTLLNYTVSKTNGGEQLLAGASVLQVPSGTNSANQPLYFKLRTQAGTAEVAGTYNGTINYVAEIIPYVAARTVTLNMNGHGENVTIPYIEGEAITLPTSSTEENVYTVANFYGGYDSVYQAYQAHIGDDFDAFDSEDSSIFPEVYIYDPTEEDYVKKVYDDYYEDYVRALVGATAHATLTMEGTVATEKNSIVKLTRKSSITSWRDTSTGTDIPVGEYYPSGNIELVANWENHDDYDFIKFNSSPLSNDELTAPGFNEQLCIFTDDYYNGTKCALITDYSWHISIDPDVNYGTVRSGFIDKVRPGENFGEKFISGNYIQDAFSAYSGECSYSITLSIDEWVTD